MNKKYLIILLAILSLLAFPCFAQEEEEAPEDEAAEQTKIITPVDTTKKASPESLAYFSLLDWPQLWEKGLALQAQDSLEQFLALAESALTRAVMLDSRQPVYAGYLKYLSQQAARQKNITNAIRYSQLALKADPSYPGLIFSHMGISFSRYGLSQSLNAAWKSYRDAGWSFWFQLGSTAGILSFISLLLLFSSLIFLLWLAIKNLPHLVHFIGEIFPSKLPAYSRWTISLVFILSVSAVLGAVSLVLPVTLLAIAGSLYAEKKEKVLLALSVLLIAASGVGLAACRHLYTKLGDSNLETVARAVHSPWNQALADKLTNMQSERPDDLTPTFCLALLEKRRGNFVEAARYLGQILKVSAGNARALNNMGNIHFYSGRIDSALYYYQAAASAGPRSGISHYNLAQIYFKQVDFKAADQERAYGLALSGEEIKSRPASVKTELVLEELIPAAYLWNLVWKGLDPLRGFSPAETASLTGLNVWLPAGMGLALLALSLVVVIIFFKSSYAAYCHLCGRIICKSCLMTTPEQDHICSECHKFTSAATSPELRQKIEANLSAKRGTRKAWLGGLSNLIAPGTALLLEKLPVWAFFLSLSWGLVFAGFCWLKLSLYPYNFWQFLSWTWAGRVSLVWLILSWLLTWLAYLKYINLITHARGKDEVKIHGR
jgi:tetratricopeptide (TPR) repeat protein